MSDTITVRYRWTVKELEAAQDYHFRHSVRPTFRIALYIISVLMVITGIIGTVQELSPLYSILVAIGLYWLLLRRFSRRWTFRRQFKRRPDKDQEVEWQITPDRLHAHVSNARSEFTWDALFKVVRTPAGYLMYPNERIFHWLPKYGFESDSSFNALEGLAVSKLGKVYNAK